MTSGALTDKKILDTIRKSDSEGCNDIFKKIYEIYFPVIEKLVLSNNGNRTEAKDIFQETLIAFYEQAKKEGFELTCSLKTYLYSIGRNLWLKRLSHAKRLSDFEEYTEVGINDELTNKSGNEEILSGLIENLNEGCKQILVLYYYDKISMKGIMEIMKLGSEQSAKNKKYKCMKQLMEIIKNSKNLTQQLKESIHI